MISIQFNPLFAGCQGEVLQVSQLACISQCSFSMSIYCYPLPSGQGFWLGATPASNMYSILVLASNIVYRFVWASYVSEWRVSSDVQSWYDKLPLTDVQSWYNQSPLTDVQFWNQSPLTEQFAWSTFPWRIINECAQFCDRVLHGYFLPVPRSWISLCHWFVANEPAIEWFNSS